MMHLSDGLCPLGTVGAGAIGLSMPVPVDDVSSHAGPCERRA